MKKIILRTLIIFIAFCYSNTLSASYLDNEKELESILDNMGNRYEKIARELGLAYWNFYSAETNPNLETPKRKFYDLLSNDTLNTIIENWYPKLSEIDDPVIQKRVNMWHRVLISAKVEYSEEIMALRNKLEKIFEVSNKKENSKENIDSLILSLIELRNEESVKLGFENYVHLTFETNGLGYEWFKNFVFKLDSATFDAYKALVEKTKLENNGKEFSLTNMFRLIAPYYRNITPQKIRDTNNVELVKNTLNDIGISYSDLSMKLVEQKLPEGVGGQGIMVDIPNDFRAVISTEQDISVWLHEMGHGLHGLYNSINFPILEGYEWVPGNINPTFAEGMAETIAWFARNIEWQKKYTELSEQEINETKKIIDTYSSAFIRLHLFNFMKEVNLYLNPEKSFKEIQLELGRKYLLIETEEFRTQPLNNIIYVSYPLYFHNYLLSDMVACQVHKALEDKFGSGYAFNKNVGPYLIEKFYSSGEYLDWNQRLVQGTGKSLDLETYLEYYNLK